VSSAVWTPPERPPWVADLITAGATVGPLALHPLDPDALRSAAVRVAGTDDFGGTSWEQGFGRLCVALVDEARLHAVGAALTRSEILRTLVNRLRIVAAGTPSGPPVTAPWVVCGTARSGTSILHELLALDPAARTPRAWEVLDSVPAPGPEPDPGRVDRIDRDVRLWDRITPEYLTMHENGGALPIECIFVTAHEFASEHWSGVHHVPSYNKWLMRTDLRDAYRWHRRQLEWLGQHDPPGRQWVLKAPSHLGALVPLFATYPDAWILQTHRDPLRTIPSTISLMATLRWMRSDVVDVDRLAHTMAIGVAMLFDAVTAMRADGRLPDERFVDVQYADLVRDPIATLRGVYDRVGRRWPAGFDTRIVEYLAAKPRAVHGAHRYSVEEFGLDVAELRARYRPYVERFGVATETEAAIDPATA
jgi:hypothetical protein